MAIKNINLGTGRHDEYLIYVMSTSTLLKTEVLDFIAHVIYTTALLICRLSGLAFYYNLCGHGANFGIVIKIAAGIVIAGYIPQICLLIFHCRPVTAFWPYGTEDIADNYTCLTWGLVYSVNSGVSLVCDVLIFGIPTAMLKILKIQKKKKMLLASILLPGILLASPQYLSFLSIY